jgi:hypothetical protein
MTCRVCRKKAGSSDRAHVCLNVGCMRRGKKPDETAMLSPQEARNLVILFSAKFDPGEPERLRSKPRRRIVISDIETDEPHCGQGELIFCGTTCLRRRFNLIVDHLERHSRIGRSRRNPIYRITKFKRTPETEPRRPASRRRTGKR